MKFFVSRRMGLRFNMGVCVLLACAQWCHGQEFPCIDFKLRDLPTNARGSSLNPSTESSLYDVIIPTNLPGSLDEYSVWIGTEDCSLLVKSRLASVQKHGLEIGVGYSLERALKYKNLPGGRDKDVWPAAPINEGWRTTFSSQRGCYADDADRDSMPQVIKDMIARSNEQARKEKRIIPATKTMEGDQVVFPLTIGEMSIQHGVPLPRSLEVYRYRQFRVPISRNALPYPPEVGIKALEYASPSLKKDETVDLFATRMRYARCFGEDEVTPFGKETVLSGAYSNGYSGCVWISVVRGMKTGLAFFPAALRAPSREDWFKMLPPAIAFATDVDDFVSSKTNRWLKPLLPTNLIPLKSTITPADLDCLTNRQMALRLCVAQSMSDFGRPLLSGYALRAARDVWTSYLGILDEATETGKRLAPIISDDLLNFCTLIDTIKADGGGGFA